MRTIVVVPYNPDWPALFRAEAAQIEAIFGDDLLALHHIGSTSVPGLAAKPIIDMLPLVRDIARVDAFNPALAAIGYEALGENGLPGRRFFRKGGDDRTHHLHAYAAGHPDVTRHLAFRDYLIAHPAIAAEYAALKQTLAAQFPHDIEGYMAGKNNLIKEIERRALAWRETSDE